MDEAGAGFRLGGMRATWSEVRQLLHKLGLTLMEEWRIGLPPAEPLPSETDEAICDIWARRIADDPLVAHPVPERFRPWVLARVAMAWHLAALVERDAEVRGPGSHLAACRVLMLDKWHSHGRLMWPAFRKAQALRPGDAV